MHPADDSPLMLARQHAAHLLEAVADERLSASFAINRWPELSVQSDPSLNAAFQALWHFEADEEQQQHELFYMDAQLALLRQMAATLRTGQALAPHFLNAYSPEHTVRFFYNRTPWQDSQQRLTGWLHDIRRIWTDAWALSGLPTPTNWVAPLISSLRRREHTKNPL